MSLKQTNNQTRYSVDPRSTVRRIISRLIVFLDLPEARDLEPAILDPGCKSNLELLESAFVIGDYAGFKKLVDKCITLYNSGLGKGPEPCLHCRDGMLPQT